MSADPLSFFSAGNSDDEDSEDSSSSDNENGAPDNQSVGSVKNNPSALPPPLTMLANAKTPEFVTSHLRTDMNWDKMVKAAPYVTPKEFKPWETALPSVETKSNIKDRKPDLTIVKQVPQTMTAAPLKTEPKKDRATNTENHAMMWSKMYSDSGFESGKTKRPRPEDYDEDLAGFCHTDLEVEKVAFQTKHQKTLNTTATFRDKEKRKRNTGQANREKMFVEEEKRILRQNFDA